MTQNYTSMNSVVNTRANYSSPDNLAMSLRENLRRLMDAAGENPHSLASKTKVTQPTIFRILEGVTVEPTQGTVAKLARHFGVTPDRLRGAEIHEPPATATIDGGPEEIALLAAFRRLDPVDREQAIADLEHRARTAEIQRKRNTAAEPPPDRQPVPKSPPSELSRARRAG
jgi:transcriptional regulator with XRE-family HTH domain